LFLAEAFTKPSAMYLLGKAGFSQSYTYFSWRNTKQELTEYFEELNQTAIAEYFRGHLWPNTPDILPEFLQSGGRPAFLIRFLLAATLGAGYGIYGPAFELCENAPLKPGGEEYLDSEKYELRHRDLNSNVNLKDWISRVNAIRKDNPALHQDRNLRFHRTDNPLLICYSKVTADFSNAILTIVNLDCYNVQSGWVDLDLSVLGIDAESEFQVYDLLGGGHFVWRGARNFVKLTPESLPAHIFRVHRSVLTERDFAATM
jgi:starch synthase (maltosyl-transferring)